jgi:hypothetical protein
MSDKHYSLMDEQELLELVLTGPYNVCIQTGVITNGGGLPLNPYPNKEGHLFVRMYYNGKRKTSAVHRLVWRAATGCVIPKEYEVHHIDGDVNNNRFNNLLCLHRLDHRKLHSPNDTEDDVPF